MRLAPPRWFAVVLGVLGVAVWVLAVVGGLARPIGLEPLLATDMVWAASFSAFLLLGVFVAHRRPDHPVGWSLAGGPVAIGAGVAVFEYLADPSRPLVEHVGLLANPLFDLGIVLIGSIWLLRYPDGEPAGPRWRWVERLLWGAFALSIVGQVLGDAPYDADGLSPGDVPLLSSPWAAGTLAPFFVTMQSVARAALVLGVPAAVASAFVRHRRARGADRARLQSLLYVVVVAAASVLGINGVTRLTGDTVWTGAAELSISVTVFLVVPGVVTMAIVRHGALDIDRLVSRTLAWALVTVTLVGMYTAAVLTLGAVVRPVAGDSDLVVATSTLLVAAAARPVLVRVRTAVDRRFHRAHVDAQLEVERFGGRLRDSLDLDTLTRETLATARRTTAPDRALLWLRAAGPTDDPR